MQSYPLGLTGESAIKSVTSVEVTSYTQPPPQIVVAFASPQIYCFENRRGLNSQKSSLLNNVTAIMIPS